MCDKIRNPFSAGYHNEMYKLSRFLFLLICVLSSACALRSPVLPFPNSKIYGEASVGAGVSIGLQKTNASDKQKTFHDPDYGDIKVQPDSSQGGLIDVDFTYSIGSKKLRFVAGTAVVWLSDHMGSRLTGYHAGPWDKWYYAGINTKCFVEMFFGLETTLTFGEHRGQLMAAIGLPKAHFDWKRQIDHQSSIYPYEFECDTLTRQGGDARGLSARVRFVLDSSGVYDIGVVAIGIEYRGYIFKPHLAGEKMRYQVHILGIIIWPRWKPKRSPGGLRGLDR